MTTFVIERRIGATWDDEAECWTNGELGETIGTVDAPYPMAARGGAETLLRAVGIVWDGYAETLEPVACAWLVRGGGLITMTVQS